MFYFFYCSMWIMRIQQFVVIWRSKDWLMLVVLLYWWRFIVMRANWLYPQEYPTLTTFFEGEIISERYPFLTRKWDASEEVDRKHWGKFPTFEPYLKTFNTDDFSYDKLKQSDEVFMRWKVFDVYSICRIHNVILASSQHLISFFLIDCKFFHWPQVTCIFMCP